MASAVPVTYQVDLGVQIALGNFRPGTDTVFVSGNFSNPDWITTAAATSYTLTPSPVNSNIYARTLNVGNPSGSLENHKFIINPSNSFNNGALVWEDVSGGGNRVFQVPASSQTLPAVYFSDQAPATPDFPFIAGADFSHLTFFENRGIVYKRNGQAQDALAILKSNGVNCVRLRLFTSSAAQAQADPYDATNNLTYTLPLAVRVKNAGLQFMLDFHYSDTWADPGKQAKPAAWTNLTFPQLVQQLRSYNSNCIAAFKNAGAMPDYVQVGNEITGGMLWPDGQVPGTNAATQWPKLGQLMNAAIQGIKDAAGTTPPKLIVHIDRGGDWGGTQWFFDNLAQQGVAFDIIGESYYPFWHGSFADLSHCLTNAAKRYNKPVIIAETSFPWTNSHWTTNIFGIPGTTNGQVQYLAALAQIVKSVPAGLGAGIVWWGAEYQRVNGVNEAGFNTTSFFNSTGNVLPVVDAFGQMVSPLTLRAGLTGTNLTLQWPLSGAGMSLTTTTSLAPSAGWLRVTNAVQSTGTLFNLALPLDATQNRFYRLQSD